MRFPLYLVLLALSLAVPWVAQGAELGRLSVFSSLERPLIVEVEIVGLQPGDEEASFEAHISPPEVFRQAGGDYNPVLSGARLTLERRQGRPVLKLTTSQPVTDPFLDVVLELKWNAGRMVRAYTFLLDPVAAGAAMDRAAVPAGTTYAVKKGDTLHGIGRRYLVAGVTLNQMLIAIYQDNRDAFLRNNINFLRTGSTLAISAANAPSDDEAYRVVRQHMAEFAEYRSQLAAAPAPAQEAVVERSASGRIESAADVPTASAAPDLVRLSRADDRKSDAPKSFAARGDDEVARVRALEESKSRLAALEKTSLDLQHLIAIRDEQIAQAARGDGQMAPVRTLDESNSRLAALEKTSLDLRQQIEIRDEQIARLEKSAAAVTMKTTTMSELSAAPIKNAALPEESVIDDLLDKLPYLAGIGVALLGAYAWIRRRKRSPTTAMTLEGGFA